MADIIIKKYDELYVRILADTGIYYQIREFFKFRPDSYKYHPKYKNGLWDGYITLFKHKEKLLYTGLVPTFIKWANEQNYSLQFDTTGGNICHDTQTDDFLSDYTKWAIVEPYDYQIDAFKTLISYNKGLCLSPTGSGKSMIIYMLCRYLVENQPNTKILITVPTIQLVKQITGDFAEYQPESDAYQIASDTHQIYADQSHDTSKKIVVSTWQSIYNKPKDWFKQFTAYICDEAHQADGKSLTGIIEALADTGKFRFGLTGTLKNTKIHTMQLMGMFGKIVQTKTTKELMELGVLTNLSIQCHVLKYTNREFAINATTAKKDSAAAVYQKEIMSVIDYEPRTKYILDLALTRPENTLILFNYVDKHGIPMYNAAKAMENSYKRQVFFISGDTPVDERERIRALFETQNNIVLFASYGTFSTGINIKNISHLILSHPTKSPVRLFQSIGRALRKLENKKLATLYDVVDDLSRGNKTKNILFNQYVERLELYETQQFSYSIKTIDV